MELADSCLESTSFLKFYPFLTKAIDVSIKPGSKAVKAACGKVVEAPILVTGSILKFLVEAKNKNDQHNNAKNIEKFFAGFNPEDVKWIKFLVAVFHDIFQAYNVQVRLWKSHII